MSASLANRVVLITGASSGLGAQFARACAAQGGRVVLGARRLDRTEALAVELRAGGADAWAVQLEVPRNQIAERILGLPGEIRTDQNVPFDRL